MCFFPLVYWTVTLLPVKRLLFLIRYSSFFFLKYICHSLHIYHAQNTQVFEKKGSRQSDYYFFLISWLVWKIQKKWRHNIRCIYELRINCNMFSFFYMHIFLFSFKHSLSSWSEKKLLLSFFSSQYWYYATNNNKDWWKIYLITRSNIRHRYQGRFIIFIDSHKNLKIFLTDFFFFCYIWADIHNWTWIDHVQIFR